MAHIFKHPEADAKGIIIFTHKEFHFFRGIRKIVKTDIFSPIKLFSNLKNQLIDSYRVRRILYRIKKQYFIGIHWGIYTKDVPQYGWVDFHLCAPGTATFLGKPYIIPLSSSNFTPLVMKNQNLDKYWDIICISKCDNKKKMPNLLKSIKKVYELGHKYKILIVIASNQNETYKGYYTNILNDYYEMFSAEQREWFTIIKTHPDTGFQGFSYTFLSHLYNQSKIFTIFSQSEGVCKVIKEAQMCGLPVVVKSDMEGGGRDYLNSDNSMLFDKYELAHETLIQAVENYENFIVDPDSLAIELREDYSLQRLKRSFEQLYEKNSQRFNGELINTDNLNRRLPSHYFDSSITWATEPEFRFKTTDIISHRMFTKFVNELKL